MNKLFVFLRLINYFIIISMLYFESLSLTRFQLGVTAIVCLWGIWDFWKKPTDSTRNMQRGIWIEIMAITLWLVFLHNYVLLFAFISPLARASIHLYRRSRLIVYGYIIVFTAFYGYIFSINYSWVEMVIFTLIFVYCSVLSLLLKERENARRLLALSGFEREQQARELERVRMTRQLHDTMGQYWTSVIRALDVAEVMEHSQTNRTLYLKQEKPLVLVSKKCAKP